jgi:DNA-binding ferritin-like protein
MVKSRNNKKKRNATQKNTKNSSEKVILRNFENEITIYFFEILLMIKLFHWKTFSYATHKATDELYGKINEHMDRFIEVLLGKSDVRIDLTHHKTLALIDVSKQEELVKNIAKFKAYLVNLSTHKAMKLMSNVDLYTIRDELLADLNQFLYLLTLK